MAVTCNGTVVSLLRRVEHPNLQHVLHGSLLLGRSPVRQTGSDEIDSPANTRRTLLVAP
jgi:hypothetical protein